MATAREVLAMVTLAAAACGPTAALELRLPGARPIPYETIRDGSGVLGYAESMLGPELAKRYQAAPHRGASNVDREAVAGAWELPAGTRPDAVAAELKAGGTLDRAGEYRDGSLWVADFRPAAGGSSFRLLLIDGASPAWETRASPEVRPGPHVYLIAYRL